METRFTNILRLLSSVYDADMGGRRTSPYIIADFKEVGENRFKLEIDVNPLSLMQIPGAPFANIKKRSDLMILDFYPPEPDDEVFTIRIMHIFGGLDTSSAGMEIACRQFLAFLNKNVGSFAGTGAYIGIERQEGMMLASLNCMLHFLVSWEDNDIANVLSFQLATMFKALERNEDPSLTILKRFS